MPQLVPILLRRGTAAAWTSANPTLDAGETGVETDTGRFKFGDGATAWNSLAYSGETGGAPSGVAGGDLSGTYPNPSVSDDSHDHTATTLPDIETLTTSEMDDTLVLAPDGAGGVEFRAETGSSGSTSFTSIAKWSLD